MDTRKKSLRVGITAILCAFLFRLFSPELLTPMLQFLAKPDTIAFLIYAETGYRVRFSPAGEILPEEIPDAILSFSPESSAPLIPQPAVPVFGDASLISMYYGCSYRPEVETLLQEPLSWDLQSDAPTVLIYHREL